jgi:hypothetical protein
MRHDHYDEPPSQSADSASSREHSIHEPTQHQSSRSQFDEGSYFEEPEPGRHFAAGQEDHDTELSPEATTALPVRKNNRKRRLLKALVLVFLTIGIVIAYYGFNPSHSVKVNISAKQPAQPQDATAKPNRAPDDVTADAIAEVRTAISSPLKGTNPDSSASVIPRAPQNPGPMTTTVLPPDAGQVETTATSPGQTRPGDETGRNAARRNQERSIRFTDEHAQEIDSKDNLKPHITDAAYRRSGTASPHASSTTGPEASQLLDSGSLPSGSRRLSMKPSAMAPTLPNFGSILPVTTLGKIYTLRSGSSIRLELTRYVAGEGWSLSKGTVLIGQIRGSEQDRAFIAITGFIDPSRDRLVNLSGEVLGDDGGSGIRGKFHKLSSGWSRAFSRVGSAAVNVAGAVAGSRISGQPVIVGDIGSRTISPFSYEVDSSLLQQTRGFVEVPAGAAAFVMVTTLPADLKGADAEPDHFAQSPATITARSNQPTGLSEDELAALLTSGDPRTIREAIPRMSPQMRRVAETLLAETPREQPDKE